eukprot:1172495-Prorocentrum_minimum.AAC.1
MNCASTAGSSRTVSFALIHFRCAPMSVSWKRSDRPVREVPLGFPELSSSNSSMVVTSLDLLPDRLDSAGVASASIPTGASGPGCRRLSKDGRES